METSHTKPQHLRHCFQADSHGFANPSSLSVRSDFEVIGEGSEKIYSSGRFKGEQIYSTIDPLQFLDMRPHTISGPLGGRRLGKKCVQARRETKSFKNTVASTFDRCLVARFVEANTSFPCSINRKNPPMSVLPSSSDHGGQPTTPSNFARGASFSEINDGSEIHGQSRVELHGVNSRKTRIRRLLLAVQVLDVYVDKLAFRAIRWQRTKEDHDRVGTSGWVGCGTMALDGQGGDARYHEDDKAPNDEKARRWRPKDMITSSSEISNSTNSISSLIDQFFGVCGRVTSEDRTTKDKSKYVRMLPSLQSHSSKPSVSDRVCIINRFARSMVRELAQVTSIQAAGAENAERSDLIPEAHTWRPEDNTSSSTALVVTRHTLLSTLALTGKAESPYVQRARSSSSLQHQLTAELRWQAAMCMTHSKLADASERYAAMLTCKRIETASKSRASEAIRVHRIQLARQRAAYEAALCETIASLFSDRVLSPGVQQSLTIVPFSRQTAPGVTTLPHPAITINSIGNTEASGNMLSTSENTSDRLFSLPSLSASQVEIESSAVLSHEYMLVACATSLLADIRRHEARCDFRSLAVGMLPAHNRKYMWVEKCATPAHAGLENGGQASSQGENGSGKHDSYLGTEQAHSASQIKTMTESRIAQKQGPECNLLCQRCSAVHSVGDKVEAQFGRGHIWFFGRVTRFHKGAVAYDVKYDDGDFDLALPGRFIRVPWTIDHSLKIAGKLANTSKGDNYVSVQEIIDPPDDFASDDHLATLLIPRHSMAILEASVGHCTSMVASASRDLTTNPTNSSTDTHLASNESLDDVVRSLQVSIADFAPPPLHVLQSNEEPEAPHRSAELCPYLDRKHHHPALKTVEDELQCELDSAEAQINSKHRQASEVHPVECAIDKLLEQTITFEVGSLLGRALDSLCYDHLEHAESTNGGAALFDSLDVNPNFPNLRADHPVDMLQPMGAVSDCLHQRDFNANLIEKQENVSVGGSFSPLVFRASLKGSVSPCARSVSTWPFECLGNLNGDAVVVVSRGYVAEKNHSARSRSDDETLSDEYAKLIGLSSYDYVEAAEVRKFLILHTFLRKKAVPPVKQIKLDHSTIVKNIVNYDLVEEVYPGTAFPLRSAAETHASNEVCEPCAQELSAFCSKGSKHSEIMDTDTGIREARIYQAPNLHDSLIQDQQLAFPLQVSKSPNWESARQVQNPKELSFRLLCNAPTPLARHDAMFLDPLLCDNSMLLRISEYDVIESASQVDARWDKANRGAESVSNPKSADFMMSETFHRLLMESFAAACEFEPSWIRRNYDPIVSADFFDAVLFNDELGVYDFAPSREKGLVSPIQPDSSMLEHSDCDWSTAVGAYAAWLVSGGEESKALAYDLADAANQSARELASSLLEIFIDMEQHCDASALNFFVTSPKVDRLSLKGTLEQAQIHRHAVFDALAELFIERCCIQSSPVAVACSNWFKHPGFAGQPFQPKEVALANAARMVSSSEILTGNLSIDAVILLNENQIRAQELQICVQLSDTLVKKLLQATIALHAPILRLQPERHGKGAQEPIADSASKLSRVDALT